MRQAIPSIARFTIQELYDMPSTLNGEQFPLNTKVVDALTEDIFDNGLLQMPEVTEFNGTYTLTGGRHRTQAIYNLYHSMGSDTSDTISALVYTAHSADEVVARVTSSNASRRMVSAEKKELVAASKYGFGTVTVEALVGKAMSTDDVAERNDSLTLALAIHMGDTLDLGKQTALVTARSIITKLKSVKVSVYHEALVDTDNVVLSPATTKKVPLFEHLPLGELVEDIVAGMDYLTASPTDLPKALYDESLATDLGIVQVKGDYNDKFATISSTISRPVTLQRNAAKYTKVLLVGLKEYLGELYDVTF
jgi:hypothetical protein